MISINSNQLLSFSLFQTHFSRMQIPSQPPSIFAIHIFFFSSFQPCFLHMPCIPCNFNYLIYVKTKHYYEQKKIQCEKKSQIHRVNAIEMVTWWSCVLSILQFHLYDEWIDKKKISHACKELYSWVCWPNCIRQKKIQQHVHKSHPFTKCYHFTMKDFFFTPIENAVFTNIFSSFFFLLFWTTM